MSSEREYVEVSVTTDGKTVTEDTNWVGGVFVEGTLSSTRVELEGIVTKEDLRVDTEDMCASVSVDFLDLNISKEASRLDFSSWSPSAASKASKD